MGTFAGGSIDISAISAEMRKTVYPWFNASIQIIDPNVGDVEWDVVTNAQSGGTTTVLWSGAARVQHLRRDYLSDAGFSHTDIVGIRVQIPFDAEIGLIRKGLQIIVTDGGSDPVLEQLSFIVRSSVNSSYAWNRTIEAETDMKSVSNSTWATVGGNVVDETNTPMQNVKVRSFHSEDGVWLLDYETTTDVLGNYELPADAGVQIIVGAFKQGFFTQYWDSSSSTSTATMITPVNHEETVGIDFVMVVD